MLTPQSTIDEPRTEKAMPQEPPHQSSNPTPVLVHSTTLHRGTGLPLCIHTIGSNTPLLINTLIDSGATGRFIDVDYVRSKNLCTQCLPPSIWSVHIAVMMQLKTFSDERMKILYALLFMCGGMVQVWAANKTNLVLANTSTFTTLAELLACIERTFGDLDGERMAHPQDDTRHDGQ